jgi:hypothetical protein
MFFSKNKIGIFITLILVILLSISRFFNFLTETHLGRVLLLAFVIFISYTHKMLGLLSVLFIIIAFNNYDSNTVHAYNFYEGFDVSGNTVDPSGNSNAHAALADRIKLLQAKEDVINDQLNALKQKSQQSSTITSSSSASTSTSESFRGGKEGFVMTDRETNMLRGKQSNSIPVFNSNNKNDDVSPTDKSIFTDNYSSF